MGEIENSENQEHQEPAPPPIPISLTITMKPEGGIDLQGPIADKILCYGLLGVAKDLIIKYHDDAKKPKIIKGGMIDFARKRFNI